MLWIVGKTSQDYLDYFATHHLPYGVFHDVHVPTAPPAGVPCIAVDFSSEATIMDSLARTPVKPDVTGLLVAGYEHYVLPASILAVQYNVPGLTKSAATAATDKTVMRQRFLDYDPSITPYYMAVHSWHDIEQFMAGHTFPVVLKPTNLMKSLFVTINSSPEELNRNFAQMQAALPAHYQQVHAGLEPGILIEEFLAGSMHTVAGFADATGEPQLVEHIVDCATARDIGIADSFLFSRSLPTTLPPEQQAAVLEVAAKGMRALGLTSCPAHVELIMTATGPKIIEIGARLGGYRPRMYDYANGIDLYQAAIATALGSSCSLTASRSDCSAAVELFPEATGAFAGITNEAQLRSLRSVRYCSIKRQPGQTIGPARDGYRAAVVVLLASTTDRQMLDDISFIRKQVHVVVSAN
ncbi:MAG TPA: ATP-grasp domain-containing protein [Candidatus Saccharimonadales bacterium]|nr:ATP-grasp domain-containing protein [Candidatus Saccharimonadales bacterium]